MRSLGIDPTRLKKGAIVMAAVVAVLWLIDILAWLLTP